MIDSYFKVKNIEMEIGKRGLFMAAKSMNDLEIKQFLNIDKSKRTSSFAI